MSPNAADTQTAVLSLESRSAVFISDLHLHSNIPALNHALSCFIADFLQTPHQCLFILGDLFEYWAGDEELTEPYYAQLAGLLSQVAAAGRQLFIMHGNRDLLLGERFMSAASATLLPDPTILVLEQERILLTHGDAYCTDDIDYQVFRQQVRQPAWQTQFLALPLAQRQQIIQNIRSESSQAKQQKSMQIMDVNQHAIDALWPQYGVQLIIHGHTHRPASHQHDHGQRWVIPDWRIDKQGQVAAGYLLWQKGGPLQLHRSLSLFNAA
ncbi:UDP-2,3-diacylglucosamine diphosphatase [Parvibium lacunae]|uniref:UDP-2,3-diacylglucosamine diphosphatase n=1 Tax=Parvibium lacunae TaxID=1888893 RepID=UPI003B82FDCE